MTDYEKLEYIHHVLQECGNEIIDLAMIETALEFVEDIREPFFDKDGNIKPLKLL